ncbi:hypothetical protein B5F07_08635 [Lachnoclostridium sp. An169]|uniref:zinc ribbon domain-containing protein n=1 Tax=Lachnoclostridium sp. An169 TaxID=1965569 RepID=UPI000B397675|nr:zinc ribbon domain-containing protein [Lachnoclostridium sp. An169]OUP84192.1 hypothetical protein B5F07_08635 [Lachnoclostridium sp. An169]
MKRILKYFIGLLFCCSLYLTVLPVLEYQEHEISVLDLLQFAATGSLAYMPDDAAEVLEILMGPFLVMGAVLLITILITAVYTFITGWKNSYIISAFGTIIINAEMVLLVWMLRRYVYSETSALFMGMYEEITWKILPVCLWCLIYVLILLGSIWGIAQVIIAGLERTEIQTEEENVTEWSDVEWTDYSLENTGNSDVETEIDTNIEQRILPEEDILTEIAGDELTEEISRCPRCGRELEPEAVFCGKCGFKVR